jgi:hypothetical protein
MAFDFGLIFCVRTKLQTYFNSSIHKLFVEGNSNQTGNLWRRGKLW